jgi:hypothetical protein
LEQALKAVKKVKERERERASDTNTKNSKLSTKNNNLTRVDEHAKQLGRLLDTQS